MKLFGGRIHSDHHALWINPKNPSHIINGNDGGLYVSYDKGEQFLHLNNVPAGQFYTVAVDNQENLIIFMEAYRIMECIQRLFKRKTK